MAILAVLFALVRNGKVWVLRKITHDKFHLDEAVAIVVADRYGPAKFGVKPDKRRFNPQDTEFWAEGGSRTPDGRSLEDYIREGYIPIGVGGPFDEHAFDGAVSDPDDCCSDRVASWYGVKDNPALKPMLEITRINDTRGGGHTLDMAQILKAMHRQYDNTLVLEWVVYALNLRIDANEAALRGELKPLDRNLCLRFGRFEPLDEVLGLWLIKQEQADENEKEPLPLPRVNNGESFTDAVVRELDRTYQKKLQGGNRRSPSPHWLSRFVDYVTRGKQRNELHFGSILEAMSRLGCGWEQDGIRNWAFQALDAVYADWQEFQEANRTVEGVSKKRRIHWNDKSFNLWILQSNNRKIAAAARNKGADVVIQRDEKGHTFVFINKMQMRKSFSDLELHDILTCIAFELRVAELQKMQIFGVGDKPLDEPDPDGAHKLLACEGAISLVRQWFYHKALMAILNGSESASNVPGTSLSIDEVVGAVERGFAAQAKAAKERESIRKDTFQFRDRAVSLWVLSSELKLSPADAFSKGADLVIRESADKHLSVHFNQGSLISVATEIEEVELLVRTVRLMRTKELKLKDIVCRNYPLLSSEGRVEIVPEWNFLRDQRAMVNEPDASATKLPVDEIIDMVKRNFRALDFIKETPPSETVASVVPVKKVQPQTAGQRL